MISRLVAAAAAALLVCLAFVSTLAAEADPLTATYIHGITEKIALNAAEAASEEEMVRLLDEAAFPRRDNLVAFLAHLGGAPAREALERLLASPPADLRIPEEDRALLMAPSALGKIASRGDGRALEILLAMTAAAPDEKLLAAARRYPDPPAARTDLIESAIRGLGWAGGVQAKDRLADLAEGWIVPRGMSRDPGPAAGAPWNSSSRSPPRLPRQSPPRGSLPKARDGASGRDPRVEVSPSRTQAWTSSTPRAGSTTTA